jgi:hypothetical protein
LSDLSDPDEDADEIDGGRKIFVYGFTEDWSDLLDLSEPDDEAEDIDGGRKIFVYGFTEDLSEAEDESEDIDGGRKIFVYGLADDLSEADEVGDGRSNGGRTPSFPEEEDGEARSNTGSTLDFGSSACMGDWYGLSSLTTDTNVAAFLFGTGDAVDKSETVDLRRSSLLEADVSDIEDEDEIDGGRKIFVKGLTGDWFEAADESEETDGGRNIFVYGFTEDWFDEGEDEEAIDGGTKILLYGLTDDLSEDETDAMSTRNMLVYGLGADPADEEDLCDRAGDPAIEEAGDCFAVSGRFNSFGGPSMHSSFDVLSA